MIKGKELRQGMGLPSPAFPVDSPLLPAARLSKPFPSPRSYFGGNFGKKAVPSPQPHLWLPVLGGIFLPPRTILSPVWSLRWPRAP